MLKVPVIIDAGPFPGVYMDFESYKFHCKQRGVGWDGWFKELCSAPVSVSTDESPRREELAMSKEITGYLVPEEKEYELFAEKGWCRFSPEEVQGVGLATYPTSTGTDSPVGVMYVNVSLRNGNRFSLKPEYAEELMALRKSG